MNGQPMNKTLMLVIICMGLLLVGMCLVMTYFAMDKIEPGQAMSAQAGWQAEQIAATQGENTEALSDIPPEVVRTVEVIAIVAGVVIVLVVILRKKNGFVLLIAAVVLILVGLIVYGWIYGDKNGDGRADPAIASMVSPGGVDSIADKAYAEINQSNAQANKANAQALANYLWPIAVVIFIVLAFVAFMSTKLVV